MADTSKLAWSDDVFRRLKPILGLPDRVKSMSIDFPSGVGLVEVKITLLLNQPQADSVVEVLRSYRLEVVETSSCQQEN